MADLQYSKDLMRTIWTFVQSCALVVISLCAVAININDAMVIVVALLLLIVIPCLLVSVVSLFYNIRFDTKKKRIFVIWNLINLGLLAFYFVSVMGCYACKMTNNYESHIDSFAELQSLLNTKIKPEYRLYYTSGWDSKIGSYNGKEWQENISNPDLSEDAILANIGLTKDDLKEIKARVKAINCTGIDVLSGDKIELTYRQQGFGEYSYLLFNHSLSEAELDSLANMCNIIPVTDRVVLEYSAGATGNLCFPRCDKH